MPASIRWAQATFRPSEFPCCWARYRTTGHRDIRQVCVINETMARFFFGKENPSASTSLTNSRTPARRSNRRCGERTIATIASAAMFRDVFSCRSFKLWAHASRGEL